MPKYNLKKLMPLTLALSIFLSSCGEKSECEIPTRHVHKYIKQITEDIQIEKYVDEEHLNLSGYHWNEEYIEINKVDELVYKLFKSNGLFDGVTNWDYLFYLMANQQDYLKFYYEYTTEETRTTTDEDGNVTTYTETVHHDGWTTNAYDSDNTGKTRLYHHRFYGYKIVYENGKFKVERSPYVDDIREIIDEYPYFNEDCVIEVYETFKFNKRDLKNLSPEDFDVFASPDLDNPNLETTESRIRSKE